MIDCLFVGMNSQEFTEYLGMVRGLGEEGGAYRDLNLSFIEYEGRPYQAMDLLTDLYIRNGGQRQYPFHNADFVWPTITYLSTFLSRRGLTFDFVNAFQFEKDALREKLVNEEVLAVAIPTTLYVVPWPIQEIIAFVRQHNERTKIVVGGPYIANVAKSGDRELVESQLRALGADIYVVSSEGEQALAALLQSLKSGDDLSRVDNLVYRADDRLVFTNSVQERNPLEDNMVDYSLFPPQAIGEFLSTRTAKSCPFACAFCNFPQQAGKYTYMSVEMVEQELNAIRAIGSVTTVTFIDDTFNVPRKRFKAILEMMIRNGYSRDFKWNCTLRGDHADDDIISLMAKAGCEGVFLGVESGSDRMLEAMNKTARRADYLRVIPRLREEGILAHANTFIGFPGETFDSVEETIGLIVETKPETFSAQPWYANPLTPVWNKREEYGIKGSSFKWSHHTMDATTACDLVDSIFLTVDDSIFLPQYGFFQWSLFYLQRQGMPLDRIKGYLRAFNAVVRERIIGGRDASTHERLMSNLEQSARFGGPTEWDGQAIHLYSGAARTAAERYCAGAFGGIDTRNGGRALERSLEPRTDTPVTVVASLPAAAAILEPEALLAAYAIVLWRLDELRAVPILAQLPEAVPLILRPEPDETFDGWVTRVKEAVREAKQHRLHAFDILAGGTTFSPFRENRPRFRAAFAVAAHGERGPNELGPDPLESDALLTASLSPGHEPSLVLRSYCSREALEPIADAVISVLERAGEREEARIGELAAVPAADAGPTVDELMLTDTFAF